MKVPEEEPAGIVREAGTIRLSESVVNATTTPDSAGVPRLTLQVALPLAGRDPDGQVTEETTMGAVSARVVVLTEPLSEADRVTVWDEGIDAVETVNVAHVAFVGTVTDAGVVSAEELSLSKTWAPPVVAALDSVTRQEVLAFCARLAAVQVSELTWVAAAVTVRTVVALAPPAAAVTVTV